MLLTLLRKKALTFMTDTQIKKQIREAKNIRHNR